jgi:ATP-binding cassette subfamily F protein uup
LEREQAELQARIGDPEFYRQAREAVSTALERLAALGRELDASYERWQELDSFTRE